MSPHRKKTRPHHHIRLLTRQERARHIYARIYNGTIAGHPLTIAQIARVERISTSRLNHYLRVIRRALKKRHIRIQRLRNKLIYVNLEVKEQALQRPATPAEAVRMWELHGTVKYKDSPYPPRRIIIDIMTLIPSRDQITVATGIAQLQEAVRDRFGSKLAARMELATIPATSESKPYFRYHHMNEVESHELW